jgi:arginine decarboxylase
LSLEATPATPLIDAMTHYLSLKRHRFHVPAHTGRAFWTGELATKAQMLGLDDTLLRFDLTELEGLDVLSLPEGCLAESQALTAQRCGVKHSFYLVNGATVGIQASFMACFQPDDVVLMPRNVHRAVSASLILTGVRPAWFTPTWESEWGIWGAVTLEQLEHVWQQHPLAKGLILSSPTYEGIASPLSAIAQWCHSKGIHLIVDEAHGALFGHALGTPPSACEVEGISAVIQSFHKTAGSLTQSAVLHLPKQSRLSVLRVQEALNHLQSTSPSYLLLASLELASAWLASEMGAAQRQGLWRNVKALRQRLHGLTAFQLLESPQGEGASLDALRLYLRHAYLGGEDWANELEAKEGISYELSNPYGALFLCQAGHQPSDFVAFMQGIQALAKRYPRHLSAHFSGNLSTESVLFASIPNPTLPAIEMGETPRRTFFKPFERLPVSEALIGRMSYETIVTCPPGVPILYTGERIQAEHLPFLESYADIAVIK